METSRPEFCSDTFGCFKKMKRWPLNLHRKEFYVVMFYSLSPEQREEVERENFRIWAEMLKTRSNFLVAVHEKAEKPDFVRNIQPYEIPALRALLRRYGKSLEECGAPLEGELVRRAKDALDRRDLQAPILQRYIGWLKTD